MSTFSKRVVASTDNGYYSDSWNTGYVYFGNNGDIAVSAAVRFTSVSIPKNSTVSYAYLKQVAYWDVTNDTRLKVAGIDEDNTTTFSSTPMGRTQTTAKVDWDMVSQTADATYTSPNLKDIVEEIVGRSGWASGNAMGFLLNDDGSDNGAYSAPYGYDDDPAKAFLLEITYTAPGSTSTTSSTSTSSSSTTTSNSTTTQLIIPSTNVWDHGIKVSKEGYSVLSEKNLKNLIFSSAKGVYGFKEIQTLEVTTNASGAASGEITHGFGYVPQCIVSVQNYEDIRVMVPNEWKYYYLNPSRETMEGSESFTYQVDSSKVYVQVSVSEFNLDLFETTYPNGQKYTFRVILLFNEISEEI
jgi:hypothetical protein